MEYEGLHLNLLNIIVQNTLKKIIKINKRSCIMYKILYKYSQKLL